MDALPEHVQTFVGLIEHLDGHADQPLDLDSGLRQLMARNPEAEQGAGTSWYWELAAGAMIQVSSEEKEPWGLEFGPIMQGQSASGELLTYPRLDLLTQGTLSHWRDRARATPNPVLRARYADLSWVFAKSLGEKKDVNDARLAIDAYLDSIPDQPEDKEVDAIQAAQRAMALALQIMDRERQTRVKDAMFALARKLEPIPFPLRRSFLLDGFGLGDFAKVPLAEEEKAYMVWLLEDVLERERIAQDPPKPTSIWDAENAAQLLSTYFREMGRPEEVRRVLESFGEVVHRRAEHAEPMVGQAWLEGFARHCEGHGQRDLAIAATQALQALGPEVIKSLKRFSQTIEVPAEEMERFVGQFVQGDLGEALGRLAVNMIPKLDYVVRQAHDLARQNPFTSLVPRALLDGMGRPMVHMPSFDTSPEVHYPMAFGEWIQFEAGFRRRVIDAIREAYSPTATHIADWLLQSPAYAPQRRELLERGLKAYLDGDYIVAIHLLVPQVEEAIRTVGGLLGDLTYVWKPGEGGMRYIEARSLHSLLEATRLAELLGPNHAMFVRVSLVMNQGLNLRNRLAHGLLLPEEFTPTAADVVFQCLLIPGLVKVNTHTASP